MYLQPSGELVAYSLIICLVVAYISVVLRCWVRLKHGHGFLDNDYILLAALVAYTGYAAVEFSMLNNPEGTIDVNVLPPVILAPLIKKAFATEILLGTVVTLSKLSLLLLWKEIFVTASFKRLNSVVIGIAIAWWIGTTLFLFFQCNPPSRAWDFSAVLGSHNCISFKLIVPGYEASNVFVDMLIIALPINEIRKLHARQSRKLKLAFVFLLGGFVVVTSAVRIRYSHVKETIDGMTVFVVDFVRLYLWTNIQLCATILCACLPTFPTLLPSSIHDSIDNFSIWAAGLLSRITSPLRTVGRKSQGWSVNVASKTETRDQGFSMNRDRPYETLNEGSISSSSADQTRHEGNNHSSTTRIGSRGEEV